MYLVLTSSNLNLLCQRQGLLIKKELVLKVVSDANPSSNRNPRRNPIPAWGEQNMRAAYTCSAALTGLGLRVGLRFELGLAPPQRLHM